MANTPGEFEFRLKYRTVASGFTRAHQHRMSVNLDDPLTPGLALGAYDLVLRDASVQDAAVFWANYMAVIQPLFHTSADFPVVELWRYTPGTFDAQFWAALALAVNGTSASAAVVDGQSIITYRTSNGGTARTSLMEGIANPAATSAFPTSSAVVNTYAAFVTSSATPFVGRDNGFLIVPINWLPGTNEALTKGRIR